jgi:hypothetical protein
MASFPGFDQLFELHDPVADRPYRGRFDYARAFELSRAEEDVRAPVRVDWAMGRAIPGDIVWTTSAHPLIISSRVHRLFDEAGLTGWKPFLVELFDKSREPQPEYAGVAVAGRCGRIDLERSQIILKRYPAGLFPHFRGHFFEEASWDGSDFCVDRADARGKSSMRRIVTRRVVDLLSRHRITNVRWIPLSEVSTSTSVFEIGSEHLLPSDFRGRVASAYRDAGVPLPKSYGGTG